MLKMNDLKRIYQTDEVETLALNGVNIEIEKGEFVAIMGPSGCGKSTLLNIIGMLDNPSTGEYWFNDENIADYNESQLSKIRKHHIGFIFQNFNLIDELTVQENIELALLYHNISASERKKRVAEVMDKVGIAHRAKHMPGQLSGGQQQRVAVARAVVGGQSMILADEPTGNLDSAHGQEVMEMLQALNDEGTTIVMVTHSPSHADYARRTIHLFDGHVVTENVKAA
ncbi:MAG: ABC transporter ATP-binding protein [Pseudomonadota bacterium]|jgi:putative ABC transport system ATP-binding protein|uniref:ABC transporter ATP-binding protein n=1 Tax=unclassified Alteromonas TaxID=2614992 RepID=UPI001922EAE0|nr:MULTISPECIES: ABC transporter ATP-binding protein [unclassified Alteromonas]MEC8230051.1 ABC transporter ATP-binding protein [Pseudomonadota bacterium]WDT86257.1 ABC transporter ATP-binding protein [Alteromonas sp. 009811495]BCO17238.1 ABC transporter ATP-binding protein [Alteromonas sp. KC3]BCO21227.1 ABC transporter ATP-binding protein [Alteromonas sp. KC14]